MHILDTPRLTLREMQLSDAPFLLRLLNDPAFIANIGDRKVRSLSEAETYMKNGTLASYQNNGYGMWLVLRKSDSMPVGLCGLVLREQLGEPDIGYAMAPEFTGLGYAYEAAQACYLYAHQQLGLQRVVGIVSPGNTASKRILEKLGLRYEKKIQMQPDEETIDFFSPARHHDETTDMSLQFRCATLSDISAITILVNSAYRGDSSRQGWTTEADLLEGTRIDDNEVQHLIEQDKSALLVCLQQNELIACVHLQATPEHRPDSAYFGLFVVKPILQGAGIGKQFMQEAENYVRKQWHCRWLWMTVIRVRAELIAYYERRGFVRTGKLKPFPAEACNGIAKVEDLQMEILEKELL